ncbi:MAG: hypothetical protein OS130_00045 [Thermodesulfobacteriota bacterium]|nr:MAG: hypothetical protein OS130_00045 [Thermodesulfobacteriota bacterium]
MSYKKVEEKIAEKSWREKRIKMMAELKKRQLHLDEFLHERGRKTSWLNGIGRGNYTPRNGRPC